MTRVIGVGSGSKHTSTNWPDKGAGFVADDRMTSAMAAALACALHKCQEMSAPIHVPH